MENSSLLPVDVGVHVELELIYEDGETENITLDIVPDKSADYVHGFLGAGTPLGRTLLGNTAGSRLIYQAGDIRFVRLLAVHPGLRSASEDHSTRRQEAYDKAVEQSHRTNIILAASSMDSKWGAYDIGPVEDKKKD